MPSRVDRDWIPPQARLQNGLFTLRQARECGLSKDQISHRLNRGCWTRVAGDVVTRTVGPASPWLRAQAAALTWPDAVVCLTTAALLHNLPVPDDGVTHVTLPRHRDTGRGLVVHEYPVGASDVVHVGRAAVTTIHRTLVDCIGRLPADQSEQLVTWAGTRDLLTAASLAAAIDQRRGAWGNVQRRRAVAALTEGAYNPAERRLHRILRRAGLSGWRADQRIDLPEGTTLRADVLFDRDRLVIEVDGFATHGRRTFQADRTRQNALVGAGYTVLRFTWWDLVERPDTVARQVRMTLRRLSG